MHVNSAVGGHDVHEEGYQCLCRVTGVLLVYKLCVQTVHIVGFYARRDQFELIQLSFPAINAS